MALLALIQLEHQVEQVAEQMVALVVELQTQQMETHLVLKQELQAVLEHQVVEAQVVAGVVQEQTIAHKLVVQLALAQVV